MRKRWITLAFYLGLYLISAFLTLVFVKAGWAKFFDTSGWARAFAIWGFPIWFRVLVGVLEIVGGVLLLVPRTGVHAAAALAVIMLGGMGTHVANGDPAGVSHEVVPLALLGLVMSMHWWRKRAAIR
jgi:uncharacterized membrane protein YphA (DoxX/SURF4 family)